MREINLIVIHCTACPPGRDSTVADIRAQHRARGWDDIGYHYLIRLDGTIEVGRPLQITGAHAYGFNANSVGVSYVGGRDGDTRTVRQRRALLEMVRTLRALWPEAKIRGHRDLPDVAKECPSFDVTSWLYRHHINPK